MRIVTPQEFIELANGEIPIGQGETYNLKFQETKFDNSKYSVLLSTIEDLRTFKLIRNQNIDTSAVINAIRNDDEEYNRLRLQHSGNECNCSKSGCSNNPTNMLRSQCNFNLSKIIASENEVTLCAFSRAVNLVRATFTSPGPTIGNGFSLQKVVFGEDSKLLVSGCDVFFANEFVASENCIFKSSDISIVQINKTKKG